MERRAFMAGVGAAGFVSPAWASGGWYLPDEALPHERTFMQWPVSRAVYRDGAFLDMVQDAIADVANTIAGFEPVVMLMEAGHTGAARRKLSEAVEIWDVPTEDLWARDSGPVFVTDGTGNLAVRSFNFNGWGGRQVHREDGRVAARVAERMGLPLLDNGLVGELGGLEHDGEGLVIAHESSWVNPNRNTGSRAEVEALILEAIGAERMIWAPGIAGQDVTDYHIDSLARFVGPGRVLIQLPEYDARDPWRRVPHETHDILADAGLEMIVIPEPERPRVRSLDFVASYINCYLCNGAVIAAQFGDARTDAMARETFEALYPEREVVMLNVDPIGEIGGGIHCATQQQPKV
ncbi:MAG: agmatine deiminase family protein [Pseudomonadota bacterium]